MSGSAKLVRTFEELEVFQRAHRISLEIHRQSLIFPAIEQGALADQVRRASKSNPANIAGGFGKQRVSKAEFRRFVAIAIGRRNAGLGALLFRSGIHQ